jgi:hypothetical protein
MSGWRRALPGAAAALLVAAAGAAALLTYRDYGVTWDEGVQARYGELVVAYFESGFRDRRADEFLNLRSYGPLFEAAAALSYASVPERRFERRHLCIALAGLAGALAAMAYARAFRLAWLPALAGLALLAQPSWWGHLFANSKDVPFAAAFAAALAVLAAWLRRPGLPWPGAAAAGAAMGVAAGIRPGGLPLLALVLAAVLAADALRRAGAVPGPRAAGTAAAKGAAAVALAWLIMVLGWPSAHASPLAHPIASMREAAAFSDLYPVLFEGRSFASQHLPAWYLPKYLAIATPLPLLGLAALGLAWALREIRREPLGDRALLAGLAALWLLAPLALFVALRPNVYDGLRHFLFLLPALALFAALGAHGAISRARPGAPRAGAAALVLAALLWPLPDFVRLHPYQSTYFNGLVGGVAGAAGRYETDYWASSYKEAMEWIDARARESGRNVRVLVAARDNSREPAAAYATERTELEFTFRGELAGGLPPGIDYYLATTRWRKDANFPLAPVVHRVGREGAVFAVVKGRRAPPAGARRPAAADPR